eukprot:COSAG06_NODE_8358_length_2194_cov_2.898807_1_plen_56_part_00
MIWACVSRLCFAFLEHQHASLCPSSVLGVHGGSPVARRLLRNFIEPGGIGDVLQR